LIHEGVPNEKIHFAGNTMIDSLLAFKAKADESGVLDKLGLRSGSANRGVARYALLTLHRPSNVDHRETFLSIFEGLKELSHSCPIIFPAHPRTQQRIAEFGLAEFFESGNGKQPSGGSQPVSTSKRIRLVDPLGYLDFMCMMKNAALVITDSGGIQEETTCLGVPCVTVRENTERPVTVTCGTNVIAGTKSDGIRKAIREQASHLGANCVPEKWDGRAATRIVEVLTTKLLANNVLSIASR